MDSTVVTVLMATFNGAAYIQKQLESLIKQTFTNWRLIIRDDGSTDNTLLIVQEFIKKDERISLIINQTKVKGACANFSELLSHAKTDKSLQYVMFCDQDDIWLSQKIEKSLISMQDQETQFKNEPVLVYTDLALMDGKDQIIPGGLKLKHQISLNTLIIFNYVLGCTMILNKSMVDKIDPIPLNAVNHDYWIALVASQYRTYFLDEKLIQYRQHTNNASGNIAGNSSMTQRLKRNLLLPAKEVKVNRERLNMLAMFLERYNGDLSPGNRKMLLNYLDSFKGSRLKTLSIMLRYSMFKNGFFQTLATFYLTLAYHTKMAGGDTVRSEI